MDDRAPKPTPGSPSPAKDAAAHAAPAGRNHAVNEIPPTLITEQDFETLLTAVKNTKLYQAKLVGARMIYDPPDLELRIREARQRFINGGIFYSTAVSQLNDALLLFNKCKVPGAEDNAVQRIFQILFDELAKLDKGLARPRTYEDDHVAEEVEENEEPAAPELVQPDQPLLLKGMANPARRIRDLLMPRESRNAEKPRRESIRLASDAMQERALILKLLDGFIEGADVSPYASRRLCIADEAHALAGFPPQRSQEFQGLEIDPDCLESPLDKFKLLGFLVIRLVRGNYRGRGEMSAAIEPIKELMQYGVELARRHVRLDPSDPFASQIPGVVDEMLLQNLINPAFKREFAAQDFAFRIGIQLHRVANKRTPFAIRIVVGDQSTKWRALVAGQPLTRLARVMIRNWPLEKTNDIPLGYGRYIYQLYQAAQLPTEPRFRPKS